MALGRGSALVLSLSLCFFLLHSHMAHAATTYTVGDRNGWTFNTVSWPKGKRFKAGDTLVFNYNPKIHNVVAVSRAGYNGCNTPKGSKVYLTGKDRIKLVKGQNFFICNIAGHCESGMKIAVNAV
ncbi:basic blue protein isoform X1 [Vigna radiata var. radiata]|uniref:Basic blue protein n=1 Tax=Vigna radiata var. radiata TaxID=3916 RepID=A0A1S3UP93_VIGRR|nr:basic blue protein isoform X1 [Vigna radiata var. radiata]